VEVIKNSYRILFSFAFELAGALYDLNPFITIVPESETSDLLVRHRMLAREQKNTRVVLINVLAEGSDAGKPFSVPAEGEAFRFQVKMPDNNFFSRTSLSALDFTNHVVYLSNEVNNISGSDLLLTHNNFVSNADLQLRSSFPDVIDLDTLFVLDIKHEASLASAYKLLDASSKCREVSYKIKLPAA
jgi:hypothetical protein